MEYRQYDNRSYLQTVKALSWGSNDDGHEQASAIVWDSKRETYFRRYIKNMGTKGTVDIIDEIDTRTWKDVPDNWREIIKQHRGDEDA